MKEMDEGISVSEKMPYWYYDKKELRHTPSVNSGITHEEETISRREGARFILQLGNKMGLRYETMATGVVYFHRFYMVHSFQEFPRHVTACCCLFLAGKVEETPKKCKDIMRHARALVDDEVWTEFGSDPREEVMTLERILLQTIKFDFIVDHPYTYLIKYAKCLKGDKKKLENIVQMAWTFVNDGLCTTLCLQWEPEIIAIALMHLAGKLNKFEVADWQGKNSKHQKWWDVFVQGISMELLEDICHQVLDLYSSNKKDAAAAASAAASSAKAPPEAILGGPTPSKGRVSPVLKNSASASASSTPTKKAKKDESSPPPTAETATAVAPYPPYTYQYPAYGAPNYPPPPAHPVVGPPPTRYAYPYPHPPASTASAPSSYPPTPNRYPPPSVAPPPTSAPQYGVQQPPAPQYASHPPAHPSPHYPPPPPPAAGGAPPTAAPPTSHYAQPPPSSGHHRAHYPPASSSYYPSSGGPPPPSSYQTPPPAGAASSAYPPSGPSYQSSSRQYYPPAT